MAALGMLNGNTTHVEETCAFWKADIFVFYLLPDPLMQVSKS